MLCWLINSFTVFDDTTKIYSLPPQKIFPMLEIIVVVIIIIVVVIITSISYSVIYH